MTVSSNKTDYRETNSFNAWFVRLDKRDLYFLDSGRIRVLALLTIIFLLLILITLTAGSALPHNLESFISPHIPWISALTALLVVTLAYTIWRELLDPLLRICHWADLMRGVNLNARVEIERGNDFTELGNDINMLARMIRQLSRNTEVQLQKHTEHISRESRSLAIQYDVASSINISRDLGELFKKSLDSLCNHLHASAGVIRQVMDSNELEVVARFGHLNDDFIDNMNDRLPFRDSGDRIDPEQSVRYFERITSSVLIDASSSGSIDRLWVVSVPMTYRDHISGIINLFFPQNINSKIKDYDDLLYSVGQHLGTAVEKYRLAEEESQLLVMQERTRMSHELHDSLAQTIAGLRIQIRVLDEIFHTNDEKSMWHQMERIEYTISEANKQLRELIAHFTVPMNKRGFISSIEEAIQRQREDTDIKIYLQNEWPSQELPANIEIQVLRIVQESLANIRKHSKARSVRVLLRGHRVSGKYYVLIEDDGIGFDESLIEPVAGEHLGLNILRDRARQINGTITIDSESGEGTQINLQFTYSDSGTSLDDSQLAETSPPV